MGVLETDGCQYPRHGEKVQEYNGIGEREGGKKEGGVRGEEEGERSEKEREGGGRSEGEE